MTPQKYILSQALLGIFDPQIPKLTWIPCYHVWLYWWIEYCQEISWLITKKTQPRYRRLLPIRKPSSLSLPLAVASPRLGLTVQHGPRRDDSASGATTEAGPPRRHEGLLPPSRPLRDAPRIRWQEGFLLRPHPQHPQGRPRRARPRHLHPHRPLCRHRWNQPLPLSFLLRFVRQLIIFSFLCCV